MGKRIKVLKSAHFSVSPWYVYLLPQYRWHTLPAFVPLVDLIAKYNSAEIQVNTCVSSVLTMTCSLSLSKQFKVLLYILHSYVSAYVQRRQQVWCLYCV